MHYYQVNYLVIPRGKSMQGTWTIYQSDKPYNPNTLKDLLRQDHKGATIVLVDPVTEISKEDYDNLHRK